MNAAVRFDEVAQARPLARRVALVQTQAEAAGAQEISRLLARELETRGHEVHQIFMFRRTDAFDGVPRVVMCAPERARNPAALGRMILRLRSELLRLRPDAVICFQHFGNLIGAPVARSCGIRRVIANHNGSQALLSPWVVRLDRWLGTIGCYSSIVVNSAATEREYESYPPSYRKRLARIDHGFGPKPSRLGRPEARASFGLQAAGRLLGSVARLSPTKNLRAAVQLLPERPTWQLAIAGQGPCRRELAELAAALGCADRVRFLGELPGERIGDLLAALDVFVFPTRTETFGLAAVEAAQAGVPVVANDIPVLREILSGPDGPCAVFADAEDPVVFGAAVARVLEDRELAGALSRCGAGLAERFPLQRMVDEYEALLR